MANPVDFDGVNFTFNATPEMRGVVKDLHVCKTEFGSISCWRLTQAELDEVARTGVVWLTVAAHGMVPVHVSGAAQVVDASGNPARAEPYIPIKGQDDGAL